MFTHLPRSDPFDNHWYTGREGLDPTNVIPANVWVVTTID